METRERLAKVSGIKRGKKKSKSKKYIIFNDIGKDEGNLL
jgi:hypothetical protein